MSLGVRLFELRQNTGLSLQKVADAIGVSKAHVWDLEKGRTKNPSFELVRKLAAYYGVSPDVLIGEAKAPAAEDQQVSRLYRGLQELSERDRAIVEAMIERMQSTGQGEPGS